MYVDDIINIHNSYQQAKQVIQTVYQIQQFNRLFFYDQIGIYRLLFSISPVHRPDEDRTYIFPTYSSISAYNEQREAH